MTILVLSAGTFVRGAGELDVSSERIEGHVPRDMMHRYLMRQVDQAVRHWKAEYENARRPRTLPRIRAVCGRIAWRRSAACPNGRR